MHSMLTMKCFKVLIFVNRLQFSLTEEKNIYKLIVIERLITKICILYMIVFIFLKNRALQLTDVMTDF